jgi:hypothetical protein
MSSAAFKSVLVALQMALLAPVMIAAYAFGATLASKPLSELWFATGAVVALLFTAANVCFSMGRNFAEEKLRLDRAGASFFLAALLTVEIVALQFLIEWGQSVAMTTVLLTALRCIKVIAGMCAIGTLLTGVNLLQQALWAGIAAQFSGVRHPVRKS